MRFSVLQWVIALLLFSCSTKKTSLPFTTGYEGKPLPAFSMQLLDSVTYVKTEEIESSKGMILFYYSPGCPYCHAEMRDMLNNRNLFKNLQLCLVTNSSLSGMKKFVDYFQLRDWSELIIGRDTGNVLYNKYDLAGVPFTAIYDSSKNLKRAFYGRLNPNDLELISKEF